MERPTWIRFTDDHRNILVEHQVAEVVQHVKDSKVCGVWRDIPKVYRRKLMKGKLFVLLATKHHPDGHAFGRLVQAKEMKFSAEVYSSVLLPDVSRSHDTTGGGGIASISLGPENIFLNLEFNGIFTPKDARDVNILINLHRETSTGSRELLSKYSHVLSKVDPDYNSIDIKVDLKEEDESLLSKGKLNLEISSIDGNRVLRGRILPKTTCNIVQAVLTSEKADFADNRPTGFAVLSLQDDGSIFYTIRAESVTSPLAKLALTTTGPSKEVVKTMAEVKKPNFQDFWANGSISAVSSRIAESLLVDDLSLHLSTTKHRQELVGRIRQRLYTEAFLSGCPFLLHGNSSAAGQIWLHIDLLCRLHYQVFVSGLASDEENDQSGKRRRHLVELVEVPINRHKRSRNHVLRKFDGEEVGDVLEDLTRNTFINLANGKSWIHVTTKSKGSGKTVDLQAQLTNLPVPQVCLSREGKTNKTIPNDSGTPIVGHDKCYFERQEYEDGYQWPSSHDPCVMCFCKRGKIKCDRIICPPSECESPINVANECCPMCPKYPYPHNISEPPVCYFHGDKKFHLAGTRWHPYIPPFGFSRCVICKCDVETLKVMCRRKKCPALPCAEGDTFREYPLDCCKKCKKYYRPDQLGDEANSRSPQEILAAGGCRFRGEIRANSSEWHPTVQPWGEITCINCNCKEGRARCRRKKCPKLTCAVKVHLENECCSRCLNPSEIRVKGNLHHQSWRRRRRRDQ